MGIRVEIITKFFEQFYTTVTIVRCGITHIRDMEFKTKSRSLCQGGVILNRGNSRRTSIDKCSQTQLLIFVLLRGVST
jgi:hypothetical protein